MQKARCPVEFGLEALKQVVAGGHSVVDSR